MSSQYLKAKFFRPPSRPAVPHTFFHWGRGEKEQEKFGKSHKNDEIKLSQMTFSVDRAQNNLTNNLSANIIETRYLNGNECPEKRAGPDGKRE